MDVGRKNPLVMREVENGCWKCESIKPTSHGRYYLITIGSRTDGSRKPVGLHRFMYEYFVGNIPEGMVVRHTCDNVLCVNPEHLLLGTQKENMADMVERGRSLKGEKNAQSKLRDSEVLEIRDLYQNKYFNQTELGDMYNVSQRHISNIVRNIGREIK